MWWFIVMYFFKNLWSGLYVKLEKCAYNRVTPTLQVQMANPV